MITRTDLQEQDQAAHVIPAYGNDAESAILHVLDQRGSCTLDELLLTLAGFTFNQVLRGVDRLSRERKVLLRCPTQIGYLVSAMLTETRSQHRP